MRGYTKKDVYNNNPERYILLSKCNEMVYPEFVCYFKNLKYVVLNNYVSFAAFSRLLFASTGLIISHHRVYGYEKGYFKTVQYNYLFGIARFLGQDVHVMLTVDLRERDEREKLEASK